MTLSGGLGGGGVTRPCEGVLGQLNMWWGKKNSPSTPGNGSGLCERAKPAVIDQDRQESRRAEWYQLAYRHFAK